MSNYKIFAPQKMRPKHTNSVLKSKGITVKSSQVLRKEKMSFKSWIKNWLNSDDTSYTQDMRIDSVSTKGIESENSIRFEVTPARGGLVITVRIYDRKTDSHIWVNHVIHDDEEVPARIAEIISMNMLRM
jgi:hypothetical protein